MSGKRNRTAGNSYERSVRKKLEEMFGIEVWTSRNASRVMDAKGVDVFGDELPVHIQCKSTTNTPKIKELIHGDGLATDKPIIVFHKKTRKANKVFVTEGEFVYMDVNVFYELLKYHPSVAQHFTAANEKSSD